MLRKYLQDATSSPHLLISVCNLHTGGCHSFGQHLAEELKSNYIAVALTSGGDQSDVDIFKQKIASPQSYHYVSVVGCLFSKTCILVEAKRKYNFSELKNAYIILPSHIVMSEIEYKSYDSYLKKSYSKEGFDIQFLTSGIDVHYDHCIGLPKPLYFTQDSKKTVSEMSYDGLIYIRDLFPDDLEKTPEEEKYSVVLSQDKAKRFLLSYFSQVIRFSGKGLEKCSVVVVASNDLEKKVMTDIAEKSNLKIDFLDRLPCNDFMSLLEGISKKGVIATNGVQTLIESIYMGCSFMFYANVTINHSFIMQLVNTLPADLKDISKVILGFSERMVLLKNILQIKKIVTELQPTLKKGFSTFKEVKLTTMASGSTFFSKPSTDSFSAPVLSSAMPVPLSVLAPATTIPLSQMTLSFLPT